RQPVPPQPSSALVELLARERDVAERAPRLQPRFFSAEAFFAQPIGLELQVRVDLRGEVVGRAFAAEHGYPLASSTRAIAVARRCHLVVSFTSCLRPSAVSV